MKKTVYVLWICANFVSHLSLSFYCFSEDKTVKNVQKKKSYICPFKSVGRNVMFPNIISIYFNMFKNYHYSILYHCRWPARSNSSEWHTEILHFSTIKSSKSLFCSLWILTLSTAQCKKLACIKKEGMQTVVGWTQNAPTKISWFLCVYCLSVCY